MFSLEFRILTQVNRSKAGRNPDEYKIDNNINENWKWLKPNKQAVSSCLFIALYFNWTKKKKHNNVCIYLCVCVDSFLLDVFIYKVKFTSWSLVWQVQDHFSVTKTRNVQSQIILWHAMQSDAKPKSFKWYTLKHFANGNLKTLCF